jgi:hypothetical protein
MGGRIYDPAQRRFLTPDPIVSDPYFDQAWHRYSYAHNNPATLTDPTGYVVPPAWMCGNVGPVQVSFGSYQQAGGPLSMPQARASLPDVTPDSFRSATPTAAPAQFSGPGYAGGDVVARWLIDHGVDAWLQENGDAAIHVSLGVSYTALTVATFGAAAEAGVFVGVGSRLASFGAASWRTIAGAAGAVGEGVRRFGNQITRWGAQVARLGRGADAAAPSVARAAPTLSADIDLLAQFGPKVPTHSDGYFNVVTHAGPDAAYILRGGKWISVSHRALAKFIQRSPGYTMGPVRLIARDSGACGTGLAKNLSNKMGVEVLAPTGKAFIDEAGSFWTNGIWQGFKPGL